MKTSKISSVHKNFSAFGGLIVLDNLIAKSSWKLELQDILPKQGSESSFRKFKNIVFGFAAGASCLDDLDMLKRDPVLEQKIGKSYSAKSCGDFLRAFSKTQCKELNQVLARQSFSYRQELFPESKSITLDIDSTKNRQYAQKMEGVCMSYQGYECLDSLHVFDEHGLPYWHDVRPGNTHTSSGCLETLHRIWSQLPKNSYYKKGHY